MNYLINIIFNDNTEEQFYNNFYLNENHIREMYSKVWNLEFMDIIII